MPQPTGVAVMHVGMPKCGSSALQAALSAAPDLFAGGTSAARYLVIRASGEVLSGEALADFAIGSATSYLVSARAAQLAELGPVSCRRVAAEIAQLCQGGIRPVFSNEGWGNEYASFAGGRLLEPLGLAAEVVVYVRPQVAWCNSAWWQWGAWNRGGFARWLPKQLGRVQWGDVVRHWRSVPGVASVSARLLPPDVVSDFCHRLGVDAPLGATVNASLSAPLLRLMQRHRELRRGPHDSAIEFAMARHLSQSNTPAPWVLNASDIGTIIDGCRASNEALLEHLDEADRVRMRDDPAWWSVDYWADRKLEPRRPVEADATESDALAAAALEALFRLDEQYREVRLGQRRLQREIDALRTQRSGGGLLARLRGRNGAG